MGISTVALRALSVSCLYVWSHASIACSCPEDPSPLQQVVLSALQDADYAALIEVKSAESVSVTREENVAIWNPRTLQSESSTRVINERLLVAEFAALRIYKGDKSPTQLETPAEASACGVALEPGWRYLVYAYGPDDNGRISTSRCMRTALAEQSDQDIEILNTATRPVSVVFQPSGPELRFNEALELIHSHPGDEEEQLQAMAIAEELAQSDPLSGYSQALQAEVLSIWLLAYDGEPVEQKQEALALIDEALRINPKLAQAHVARARTYASVSMLAEAEAEIETALRIQPKLNSAFFVQAEIYRGSGNSAKAAEWMRNFMAATKEPAQKANGYQWLGNMWRDFAYHPEAVNREVNLLMARSAFQGSVDLDPDDAGRLVNFSAFLNDLPADFAAAEKYATKALALEESPAAHYHLAAARYQALQAQATTMNVQSLRASIAEIETETEIPLEEAVQYDGFREVIHARLTRLQIRAQRPDR